MEPPKLAQHSPSPTPAELVTNVKAQDVPPKADEVHKQPLDALPTEERSPSPPGLVQKVILLRDDKSHTPCCPDDKDDEPEIPKTTLKQSFEEHGIIQRFKEIDQLFRNNVIWAKSKIEKDPDYFIRLKDIQRPDFLWIGCADSRVPANEIVGLEPGEIFVHRNIGNLVLSSDLSLISCVEFAVTYLNVKHIIVCGHFGCSGVKYAYQSADVGLLNPWLTSIKENYRHNRKVIEAQPTEEERIAKFVEYNVIEGCMTLMKMATIQKAFAQNKFPVIHACVYDLGNGKLINLNIDFIQRMKDYGGIYNFGFKKSKV
jgi:carbonic anhydrase